jgi:hypothetical protein
MDLASNNALSNGINIQETRFQTARHPKDRAFKRSHSLRITLSKSHSEIETAQEVRPGQAQKDAQISAPKRARGHGD